MKIKRGFQYLLNILLGLAILISMLLSFFMWTNPSHYTTNMQKSSNNTINKSNLNVRPISNIYSPTQMIENQNQKQSLLINPSINMIGEVRDAWSNYRNLRLSYEGKASSQEILKLLKRDNSLVLNYNSSVSLSLLSGLFNHSVRNVRNATFNRMVMPTDRAGVIYLFNDSSKRMYQLHFDHANVKRIHQIINDKRITREDVYYSVMNKRAILNTKHVISLPQYSYLMNRQVANYYSVRFLGDAQNVNVKHHKHYTTYSDQSAKQMYFYNAGNVDFSNDQPSDTRMSFEQTLQKNYQRLVDSGVDLDNIHFFDATKHRFDYRLYVEGFPIFGSNNSGLFRINLNSPSSLKINFSLKSLQIPTPTNGEKFQLPKTQTVIKNLEAHGYKSSQIQHIEIGYKWENDNNSKLVVNLMPTWYIKINNNWNSYSDLMNN